MSIAVIIMSLLLALNMLNSFSACDSVVDFKQVFVYWAFSNIAMNPQMHLVTNVFLCRKMLCVSIYKKYKHCIHAPLPFQNEIHVPTLVDHMNILLLKVTLM